MDNGLNGIIDNGLNGHNGPINGGKDVKTGQFVKGNKLGGRTVGAVGNLAKKRIKAEVFAGKWTPLKYLNSVLQDESATPELRIEAASILMPYLHPRASPRRMVQTSLELGPVTTVADAAAQIIQINNLVASQQYDALDGEYLVRNLKTYIDILVGVDFEARLRSVIAELRSADSQQPPMVPPPYAINGHASFDEGQPP
jgi:hypothetical protein